jgi:hypothetical protein
MTHFAYLPIRLSDHIETIQINLKSPVWLFSKNVGKKLGFSSSQGDGFLRTTFLSIAYQGILVNSVENRFKTIGELISNPSKGVDAYRILSEHDLGIIGNSTPREAIGERSTCLLCQKQLKRINPGASDDPLMQPFILKCGDAFHKNCLQKWEKIYPLCCPKCSEENTKQSPTQFFPIKRPSFFKNGFF